MKLIEVIRRYNRAWDAHYAEAPLNLFKKGRAPLMCLGAVSVIAIISAVAAAAFQGQDNNQPWYPSLQAFEHYNSGRSHVFSQAEFRGSLDGLNRVAVVRSADGAYPSGYNMAYLNEREAFIQGGSYGDVENSIGPFVAKIDPKTLETKWYTQLRNTKDAKEWDYPGGMAIESDGMIYVVSGYYLYKVHPEDGHVIDALPLPTMVYMRNNYPTLPAKYDDFLTDDSANTSYNGINALPDGTIVVKSVYRVAGCDKDGGSALLKCENSGNVPRSNLISINPHTMQTIQIYTLPAPAPARPTITRYHGVDYVYLLENTALPVRYSVSHGIFTPDTTWTPPAVSNDGQEPGGSLIVMNDWIVGNTNTVPATGAMTTFAINQGDASKYYSRQPFKDDPVDPVLAAAFATASPGMLPAISWDDMSLEADPENGLFYGVETLARKVAAFRICDSGIETVWKKTQTTTEWATLIGPKEHRVWVGTDVPLNQIPGANTNGRVVWRDASTGRLLARSELLPAMTQGTAVQPGYRGSMYFPGATGMLVKLTPSSVRGWDGGPQP
jgi:hypothetical protein